MHFDDFLCYELRCEQLRWIGGFGEMSWVGGERFHSALPDPVTTGGHAEDAIRHCNEDHADAMVLICRAFSGLGDGVGSATMLSLDRYGFDVLCDMPDGKRRSRVAFSEVLTAGDSTTLRMAMVDMTQRARAHLGVAAPPQGAGHHPH